MFKIVYNRLRELTPVQCNLLQRDMHLRVFTPTDLLPLDGTGRHEAVHHSRHRRRLLVPARPARLLLLRLLQASCLGHAAVGAHDQRGGGAAPAGHPGGAQLAVAAIKPRKLSMVIHNIQTFRG